jgi:hypothetical protein
MMVIRNRVTSEMKLRWIRKSATAPADEVGRGDPGEPPRPDWA